jgi:hypothetical protein
LSNFSAFFAFSAVNRVEKTKPIVSFCVPRSEFSVKIGIGGLKKQSEITPKGVEWRPGDCFSRDIVVYMKEIWYKAYV